MRQLLKITSLFAFALVFTAGMAFGQNIENLDQTDADADIRQLVSTGSNIVKGIRPPNGVGQRDAFTQTSGSVLEVNQLDFGGGTNHFLEGEQEGTGDHEMRLDQTGDASQTALIDQKGGSNNTALLNQHTYAGTGGNDADVVQRGSDNVLAGDRLASHNVSFPGAGTSDRALQGNRVQGGIGAQNNELLLRQKGVGNELYMQQLTNDNLIQMRQRNGSFAEISQFGGSGNVVAANETAPFGQFESINSVLRVEQDGADNTVFGTQTASGSVANIDQLDGSTAETEQVSR